MKRNSIEQIVNYLNQNPFVTETEILGNVFGFYRKFGAINGNKKYADMIRRGLNNNKIARVKVKVKNVKSQYFYYLPRL